MASAETAIAAFILFWLILFVLGLSGKVKRRGIEVKPFFFLYRTDRANSLLEGLADHQSVWRPYSKLCIFVGMALMALAVAFLILNLLRFVIQPVAHSPVIILIPGLTLQSASALIYFSLSVPIILIVHEGAHGVIARLERIRVRSGGFGAFATLIFGFIEPDDDDFKRASPKSQMKVLGAGSTSNVIFSFMVAALLLFDPFFAIGLPAPVRSAFYGPPSGVPVAEVLPNSGAEAAGLMADDVITGIKDIKIRTPDDLGQIRLKPGEDVSVSVIRKGVELAFNVKIASSPDSPDTGILGIKRVGYPHYPPKLSLGFNLPREASLFLMWLFFLSFNIGLFNMLPFRPLDGDGFLNALLRTRLTERASQALRYSINIFAISLLAANLITSFVRSGFITL